MDKMRANKIMVIIIEDRSANIPYHDGAQMKMYDGGRRKKRSFLKLQRGTYPTYLFLSKKEEKRKRKNEDGMLLLG